MGKASRNNVSYSVCTKQLTTNEQMQKKLEGFNEYEAPKSPIWRRRRRRGEREFGRGYPLPSRLGDLGSVLSFLSRVRDGAPAADAFSALLMCH